MSATTHVNNPRWNVAEQVADAVRRRYSDDVLAVGVHGALAHGDDDEECQVDVVVVTKAEPGPGITLRPATRRIDGIVVDLTVIAAADYLHDAATVATSWPLRADQFLVHKPLWDPSGWYDLLRDTHLSRLARTGAGEFAELARDAWFRAYQGHNQARRLALWVDSDAALVALAEARVRAAIVEGLLSRTYFRDAPDAVRRTDLSWLDLTEVGTRLKTQAEHLATRGRPVDGQIADLFAG